MTNTRTHEQIGKASKAKGGRGERDVVSLFRENGYDAHRTQQYCGYTEKGAPDVDVSPFLLHVEVKRRERLNLQGAIDQAVRDHKEGTYPVVFSKRNNCDWIVSMPQEVFFEMYREWVNGQ